MGTKPGRGPVLFTLGVLLVLLLGTTGWALLTDEAGLRFEFFSLTNAWEGEPLFSDVREPRVDEVADLSVAATAIFSARWRGWLAVEEAGEHAFAIWADNAGYLEIGSERLLDTTLPPERQSVRTTTSLETGVHPIEIGLIQMGREAGLGIEWTGPGGEAVVLPVERLYSRRPVRLYRLLRRIATAVSPLGARWIGASMLLSAFLSLRFLWRRRPEGRHRLLRWWSGAAGVRQRLLDRIPRPLRSRRALFGGFFLALFVFTLLRSYPWTTCTLAGDDAAYLRAALFGPESLWYFNRMAHVYLLKVFIWLFGAADVFFAARVYGAFVLAVTVTALAVAARSLGPKLQLRTFALAVFLLFTQLSVTGSPGAPFTDYTLMMVLTAAVAVTLHGRVAESLRTRHEWHALVLGGLTVVAGKTKVTGVIILFLLLLLLWTDGRVDWRRFARRMAYWAVGFGAALLVLMTADAIWMDDFLWSVRWSNFEATRGIMGSVAPRAPRSGAGWMGVLWPEGGGLVARNLGYLALLAGLTPFVAAARRASWDRRIFYLMPPTYFLMVIVVFSLYPKLLYSGRMLAPILPTTCLVGAALFYHLGIEQIAWRELLAPRAFVPLFLGATFLGLIVLPHASGALTAEELVPLETVTRIGWPPDSFLEAVQTPAAIVLGWALVALLFHRRRARLAVALFLTFALLGPSFQRSATTLSHRFSAQRAAVILYPWRAFEEDIEALRPRVVFVSPDAVWRTGMFGRTRSTIASVYFARPIYVPLSQELPRDAEVAIASVTSYNTWRRALPELESVARFDPSGQLVLLRPAAIEDPVTAPGRPLD